MNKIRERKYTSHQSESSFSSIKDESKISAKKIRNKQKSHRKRIHLKFVNVFHTLLNGQDMKIKQTLVTSCLLFIVSSFFIVYNNRKKLLLVCGCGKKSFKTLFPAVCAVVHSLLIELNAHPLQNKLIAI